MSAHMDMTTTNAPSGNDGNDADAKALPRSLATPPKLKLLHCAIQSYPWGKIGSASQAALLKRAQSGNTFAIDEDTSYAELWIGTHPNGMAQVIMRSDNNDLGESLRFEDGGSKDEKKVDDSMNRLATMSLRDYLQSNASLHCGSDTGKLPFLFKVLSVRTALSIQAHPDRNLARQLHATHPDLYPDDNHKPELAIALTPMRALCGFRAIHDIAQNADVFPEFGDLIGADLVNACRTANLADNAGSLVKSVFSKYMDVPVEKMQPLLQTLVQRLQATDMKERTTTVEAILQLHQQFPNDNGVWAPLLMNVVTLEPGDALFIAANELHAYLSGDLLECMACSDNVVRAGLTNKHQDRTTLVDMLTYRTGYPAIQQGGPVNAFTVRYAPPVSDFCVDVLDLPPYEKVDMSPVPASASVLLVLEGSARLVQLLEEAEENVVLNVAYGSAIICSADTAFRVRAGPKGVRLTRAMRNTASL